MERSVGYGGKFDIVVEDTVRHALLAIELAKRVGGTFELDEEKLKRRGLTDMQIYQIRFRVAARE